MEGYEFNRAIGECEDTICKLANCLDCSISGVEECDLCAPEHYFDYETGICDTLTCKIDNCDKCVKNPKKCEQCA